MANIPESVRKDLYGVGIDNIDSILFLKAFSGDEIAGYGGDQGIITDNKNKIEFSTARRAVSTKSPGILQDIWLFKAGINEKVIKREIASSKGQISIAIALSSIMLFIFGAALIFEDTHKLSGYSTGIDAVDASSNADNYSPSGKSAYADRQFFKRVIQQRALQ